MRKAKDIKELHNLPRFQKVVKQPIAYLRNHAKGGSVRIRWDLNDVSKRDQIIEIKVGSEVARIDKQELMHYLRAV